MLNIFVNGAKGKMGQATVNAIKDNDYFVLAGTGNKGDDLAKKIQACKPDVVVDFTIPDCIFENAKTIIAQNCHPVIGTTGLTTDQIATLTKLCEEKQLGGIIAPNFSITAILLMQCAKTCAKYLPNVEIIEMHHDKKLDAPSGTAIKTAEMINSARTKVPLPKGKELIKGARGANKDGIPIHSVRLKGLLAHEMVIFGGIGETLTLRQDTLDRSAFMAGVLLACRKALTLDRLIYGLENIIT